jgi:predicted dehydrogenase
MYTIVGSGFGLYGYLPALVERMGATVVLPRAYEAKVRARPELAGTLGGIRWADDAEAALSQATGVVIATPPQRQVEVVSRCIALPRIERLVLEKPLAATPALASAMLAGLDGANKRYRVGYTLLHASWHRELAWPPAPAPGASVSITWTFMAHHFAHRLSNWKRVHDEGGGVLRFFGVHLVALLALRGYDGVRSSMLEGEDAREPERWQAVFSATGLPDCRVRVDSRCDTQRFEISDRTTGTERALLALQDPFEQERAEGGADRRVGVLERMLQTFEGEDRPFHELYARVNTLWRKVEDA